MDAGSGDIIGNDRYSKDGPLGHFIQNIDAAALIPWKEASPGLVAYPHILRPLCPAS
jgi:hypothetical protein